MDAYPQELQLPGCPTCRQDLDSASARFCGYCGQDVTSLNVCRCDACGTSYNLSFNYCPFCGAPCSPVS